MARKPDRFERMVDGQSLPGGVLAAEQVVRLLRRQHRDTVRLVRKVWDWQGEQHADNEDACEVIIRELKKYAK